MGGGRFDLEDVEYRAGLCVLRVVGRGVVALFAGETGGHRWQRVPPTERRGRVHTSTVTVAVLPEPAPHEVIVREADLEWHTMRASGSGGQHLQKTDSAVRVRHKPTGLEVRCETERSQSANRETALRVLRARLAEAAREQVLGARADERRRQVGSGQRGDKRRTIRTQDDHVVDHIDGRSWSFKRYVRGDW
ncbi:MAG: PCRF domain-containing protein [Deltaproteobacteria bacterium]|nr:PCRF domain-containing protein [Deltaproteobacteria bacterium]